MALRPDFTGVLKGRGFQPRRCAAKWVAALQFAEKLSGSPCSIVLVIPTPNAAEESATPKSLCTQRVWTTDAAVNEQDSPPFGVGMTKRGCSALAAEGNCRTQKEFPQAVKLLAGLRR